MFKLTSLIAVAVLTSACAKESFSVIDPTNSPFKKPIDYATQGCAPDSADYVMQVNVVSFAMTSDTGVSFGFDLKSGWFEGIKLDARIKQGQLALQGVLADPLKLTATKVKGVGRLNDSSFSFKVDTSIVDFGMNSASQTSLTRLAEKGIVDVLRDADQELKKNPNAWQTTIQAIDDERHFVIHSGYKAGVVKGDKFNIYEEKWEWDGTPCASKLKYHRHQDTTPIAVAEVVDVEDDLSIIKLTGEPKKQIKLGDTVEVASLVKDKSNSKRKLKKSVRLRPAFSHGKLVVHNLGEINIPYYLDYVTEPVMNDSNFWITK